MRAIEARSEKLCFFRLVRMEKAGKTNVTVTFHRAKKGLLVGKNLVEEFMMANVDISPEAEEVGSG